MQHATIDRERDGEAPTIDERYQMHSRHIRSKGDRHQVNHGQTGILSLLPHFDYEHEHRFTEHEHDNCVEMTERHRSPDGGERVSMSKTKLPPFRWIGLFALLRVLVFRQQFQFINHGVSYVNALLLCDIRQFWEAV